MTVVRNPATEQNSSKTPSSKSPCLISGRFNTVLFLHDRVTPICLIRGRPFLNNLGPLRLPQLTQGVTDCRCDVACIARGRAVPHNWATNTLGRGKPFRFVCGARDPFQKVRVGGFEFCYRLGVGSPLTVRLATISFDSESWDGAQSSGRFRVTLVS